MNRRSFIARTSALAAATTLPSVVRGAVPPAASADLRLGLISAATYGRNAPRTVGSHHGTAFATTFNGWDEAKTQAWKGTFVRSPRRLPGARVVTIWDPNQAAAQQLADLCDISRVASTPEAACEGVDAVLVVDDGSGEHWKYALHPLQKGVPVFCDKPLAMNARDAQSVANMVRTTKTRFLSASSLRFVPDIVRLKQELPQLGRVHLASASCGNELLYYGIHALSMIYALFGPGAISAMNVGSAGRNIIRYRFKDDRDVVLTVADPEFMRAGYLLTLQGTKAWRSLQPDLTNLYSYLLEQFLDLVRTGREPVPVEEEVELIAALEAGRRSLELGREVAIERG